MMVYFPIYLAVGCFVCLLLWWIIDKFVPFSVSEKARLTSNPPALAITTILCVLTWPVILILFLSCLRGIRITIRRVRKGDDE